MNSVRRWVGRWLGSCWSRVSWVVVPVARITGLTIATVWRRLLVRTTFIVISGSVGKTTAKDACAHVLAPHFSIFKTPRSFNHYRGLILALLSVRPWHRYAVIEIGLSGPGQMKWLAWAARPDVAVWLSVARTHQQSFRTLEVTAQEKSLLIESLRQGGVAVLNDDNPYIAAYRAPERVEAIRYGGSERAEWRAAGASSKWPERLSFRLDTGGETVEVTTRMVGTHWLSSMIPAMVVAKLAGLSLAQAAERLATFEPPEQRMAPVVTPRGVTFLRDERNGSIDTLRAALKVLGEAQAQRKVLIFSDISDSRSKIRTRQRDIGREAAIVADAVLFVGDSHEHAVKAALEAGMPVDRVWGFHNLKDAAEYLRGQLREGDLVLLRGRHADHLSRLYLAQIEEVTCWRTSCGKKISCDVCPEKDLSKVG